MQLVAFVIGAAVVIGPNIALLQGWLANANRSVAGQHEPLFTDRDAQRRAAEQLQSAGPSTRASSVVLTGTTIEADKSLDADSSATKRYRYGVPGVLGNSGVRSIGAGSVSYESDQFSLENINCAIIDLMRTKTIEYFAAADLLPQGTEASEIHISTGPTVRGLQYQVVLDSEEERSATFDAAGTMVYSVPAPDDEKQQDALHLLDNAEDYELATSQLQQSLAERGISGVNSVFVEDKHIMVFASPTADSDEDSVLTWRLPQLFGATGVSVRERKSSSVGEQQAAASLPLEKLSWELAPEVYERSLRQAGLSGTQRAAVTDPSVVFMHADGDNQSLIHIIFTHEGRKYSYKYGLDGAPVQREDR